MTIPGIFSQRDARWASNLLGYNTERAYNIYSYGCAITAASNVIWEATGDGSWTPDRINNWLRDNAGFEPGGGLLRWYVLANLLQSLGITYHGFTTSLPDTNSFLSPENNFAIAQLTKPGFPMHFSAMPYVAQLADSWDAKLKPVGSYTFVGAHLYTKVVPQSAPVVPAIETIPVQAEVQAPAVPVPSNDTPVANPTPETETPPPADPTLPEYETSWSAWSEDKQMTVVRSGAYAFDAVTNKAVTAIGNGDTRAYAGSFSCNGVTLVRTRFATDNGKWIGVPASFFETDPNYTNAPLPTTTTTNEAQGFTTELQQEIAATVTFWKTVWLIFKNPGGFREFVAQYAATKLKKES